MIKCNTKTTRDNIVGVMPDDQYLVVSPIEISPSDMRGTDLNREAGLCSYKRVLGFAVTSRENDLPLILVEHRNNVRLFHQDDFAAMVARRECHATGMATPQTGTIDTSLLPGWAQELVQEAYVRNVVFNWLYNANGETLVPKHLVKKVLPRMTRLSKRCDSSLLTAKHVAMAMLKDDETDAPREYVAAFMILSDSRVLLEPPVEVLRAQKKSKLSLFHWLCKDLGSGGQDE